MRIKHHGPRPAPDRIQVCRIAQNLAEPPPGLLILAPDQAEVTVIATCGHGFADDDLEIVLFVVPVPDVAAVDADDDCRLRERLAIGGTALDGTRLLAAEAGFVAGGNLVQATADGRRVNGRTSPTIPEHHWQ